MPNPNPPSQQTPPNPNKDAMMTYNQFMDKKHERDAAYASWVMKQGSQAQKAAYLASISTAPPGGGTTLPARTDIAAPENAQRLQTTQDMANADQALSQQSAPLLSIPGLLPNTNTLQNIKPATPEEAQGPFWTTSGFKDLLDMVSHGTQLNAAGPVITKISPNPQTIPPSALPTPETYTKIGLPPEMAPQQFAPPVHADLTQMQQQIPRTVSLLPEAGGAPIPLEPKEPTGPILAPGSPLANVANFFKIPIPVVSQKQVQLSDILGLASIPNLATRGMLTAQPGTNVIGDAVQLGFNTLVLIGGGVAKSLYAMGAGTINAAWATLLAHAADQRGDHAAADAYRQDASNYYLQQVNDVTDWTNKAQQAVNNSWNNLSAANKSEDDIQQQVDTLMKEKGLSSTARGSTAIRQQLTNELLAQRVQNYKQQSVNLTSQANQQYQGGDIQGAVKTMQQAIQFRIQADPMGQYGAYTWTRQPEALDAFTKNAAYVELQKGTSLTDTEIQTIKDHFSNSWTELAGETIFDPLWLVPQKVWDLAFEPVKMLAGGIKELADGIPVIGDVTMWMQRQTSGSVAGKIFRTIDEFWGRFAKSYSSTNEVIADTNKIEDLARLIHDEQLGPQEAEALFQESKTTIRGLNQFGHYSDFKPLVDLAGDKSLDTVGRWSTAMQNALDNTEMEFQRQAIKDATKELGQNAIGSEAFKARVNELVQEYMSNVKYIDQTLKPFGGKFTEAYLDPRRIYNYERGYQGARLLQDSILGRTIQLMREFAGEQVNEKVLPKMEELGPIGKWLMDHGYTFDNTDKFFESAGQLFGSERNPIRRAIGSLGRGIEGILTFGNNLRDMWATAVLSLNPSWVIRKYTDMSLRHFIYGGNMWDDIRALNLSLQREMEDQIGQHFDVFAQALARTIPNWEDRVASRFEMGWDPGKGPFQAYSYWKYAYDMLGADRTDEIAAGYMKNAGLAGKVMDVLKAVPNAMQDYTTTLEYTIRLRALHEEYFKALETLEPKVLDKVMSNVAPELQDLTRMAWRESDGNPEKLSQIIKSVTNDLAQGKASWSLIVPPELKDIMPNMTLQDEKLFIGPTRDALQEMIRNAQKAGQELTKDDFHTFFQGARENLQNEIQANAAQQYGEREISGTLNTTGDVSRIPTETDGPHPVANPTREPAGATPKQAAEAAQKINASRFPLNITDQAKTIDHFTAAISPMANVERMDGNTIRVVMGDDGKPLIQIGREVTDMDRKNLYSQLLDATIKSQGLTDSRILAAADITNSDHYVQVVRNFLNDPAKFAQNRNNEKAMLTILDQFNSNQHYEDMVQRLFGEKVNYDSVADLYRNLKALPEYNKDGIPESIAQLIDIADADAGRPAELRIAGISQAQSTVRVGTLIRDESLPVESRQALQNFLDIKTVMEKQYEQYKFYTGPKLLTGQARRSAWNLYYRDIGSNYNAIDQVQKDLVDAFVRSPEEGKAMLDQIMTQPEDYFLNKAGIKVDWNPDHTQITNVTLLRNGRSRQVADPNIHQILYDYFYSDYAHRFMSINNPIKMDINGVLPLAEQARVAVRNVMGINNGEAQVWSKVMDTEAKNWAAQTGLPIEDWYKGHGFQNVGTGGNLDAAGLVNFLKTAVGKTEDGTTMLYGFANTTKESLVDSTSTLFYNDLKDRASKGVDAATESLKRVNAYIEQTTGQKVKETLTSEQAKVFADQFKTYIARGDVSNVNLIKPFNEMKSWLSDAYSAVKGSTLEEHLAPDVKQALDQMLNDSHIEPPKGNARQIQIIAKDMGIDFKNPDELKSIVDAHYSTVGTNRDRIATEVLNSLKGNQEQADATMRIADSMAQYWSRQTGHPAAEWYGQRLAAVQSTQLKQVLDPTMLRQSYEETNAFIDGLISSMKEKASPEDYAAWEQAVQGSKAIEEKLLADPLSPISPIDVKEMLGNQMYADALMHKYGVSVADNPIQKFVGNFAKDEGEKAGFLHNLAINTYRRQQATNGIAMRASEAEQAVKTIGEDNILRQLQADTKDKNFFNSFFDGIKDAVNPTNWHNFMLDVADSFPLFQDAKGAMTHMPDGRSIINMFRGSDVSTIIHELAHTWREDLSPQDLETIAKWTGLQGGGQFTELRPAFNEYQTLFNKADKTTEEVARMKELAPNAKSYQDAEEQFARGFERYLAGGKAPNDELKPLFQRFREWLLNIYNAIKGSSIDIKLSPEVRGLFDNLLTSYIPTRVPSLGDVAVGDAQKAFNFFKGGQVTDTHAISEEIMSAWTELADKDPVLSSLPDHAKVKPDAMKAYLQSRIQNEHPETASMYRDALWRVEQFQDAMTNFHSGDAFHDLLYPTVNIGKMDTGIKTWIAHRNYQIANYDQAFNALTSWEKYMTDAVDHGGTIYQTYTKDQVAALNDWAKGAATAKGNLVSSILNGGNVEGTNVEGAVDKVNRQMVDYQTTTQFDQLMKNAFPFWKFPSRSWPFWAEALATHPEVIAMYNKMLEASQSQLYQAGATTTGGQPKPSMIGYFNIPGTDMWYNPTAPFSAKYALDIAGGVNRSYISKTDPNAGMMDQLTQMFMEESRVYGFSLAPWMAYALQSAGVSQNIVPSQPLVPEINLIPRWWVNDLIRMGRQMNLPFMGGAQKAEDTIYPDVQGSDYLVENRVLSDTLARIQNMPLSDSEKLVIVSEAEQAISQKGDNTLWKNTYQEVSQDTTNKNWFAFFTGIYPKQFTTNEADLLKLRDMNSVLKSSMNNELQAKMFNIPTDPTQAWSYYKAYQSTPESWINRLHTDIGWVTNDQGQVVDQPQQRALLLAQKLQQDSITQSYYNALDNINQEYQARLHALPVGATYEQKSAVYQWRADQIQTIDKLYPLTYQRKYGTYQPVSLIQQNITNQWYYTLRQTEPTWNRTSNETYAEWQARIQDWYKDLPLIAQQMMYGRNGDSGFMNSPSINDITSSLHTDQPLGQDFFQNLVVNSTQDGMHQWDLNNDTMFDAVNKAYNDMYYKTYWDAVLLPQPDQNGNYYKKGPEEQLALYDWSQAHPTPTAEDINNWVQQMYPGRFDPKQIMDWVNQSGVYSVPEEQDVSHGTVKGADGKDYNVYQMQQDIWNMLSWNGPSKGQATLGLALTKVPGLDGNTKSSMSNYLNTFVQSGGTYLANKPEQLAQLYNAMVQASQQIGMQPPSRDQILEYIEAKNHNDQFQSFLEQKLGTDQYNALMNGNPATGTLSYWQQAFPDGFDVSKSLTKQMTHNFRLENPNGYKVILEYYHLYDMQVSKDPLWAAYYGPTAATSGRLHVYGEPKRKWPKVIFNPTVNTSGAGVGTLSKMPPDFQRIAGSSVMNEVSNFMEHGDPVSPQALSFLTQLNERHPEWNSFLPGLLDQMNMQSESPK
jgi:hypothetical protein